MKIFALTLCFTFPAVAEDPILLWRDPGGIASLDLASGPGGKENAPRKPFTFAGEEKSGVNPKIIVTDAKQKKWMVKFGTEAKAENFASRISWAAGYPARASYYVREGNIEAWPKLKGLREFVDDSGSFQGARFQMFDHPGFRQVDGQLDLQARLREMRELNGLKLLLLLVANWDVKPANTGVFEIAGRKYSVVTDWGGSMGDPANVDARLRKWSCEGLEKQTATLIEGVEGGYVHFNYYQYASRHEDTLANNIRLEDLQWFVGRMSKLTGAQIRAGLAASGATEPEADCFTRVLRTRLNRFADVAKGNKTTVIRTRTVTKTTTTTVPE